MRIYFDFLNHLNILFQQAKERIFKQSNEQQNKMMTDQIKYKRQQENNYQEEFEMPKIKCKIHQNFLLDCLNLNTDSINILLCLKCAIKNHMDINSNQFVNLEEIFSKDSNMIIQNWPPLIDQNLYEQLINITKQQEDQRITKSILEIRERFDQLRNDAIKIINNHEKYIIAHINQIEDFKIDIAKIYNQISQKEEIKTQFFNKQNNLQELEDYLKKVVLEKQKKSQQNNQELQNLLDNLQKQQKILSFDRIESFSQDIMKFLKQIQNLNPFQQYTFQNNSKGNLSEQLLKKEIIEEYNQFELKQELLELQTFEQIGRYKQSLKIKVDLEKIPNQYFDLSRELPQGLNCLTQLTHLELNLRNKDNYQGFKILFEKLQNLKRLNYLKIDLSFCKIEYDKLIYLSKSLKSLKQLSYLELNLCNNYYIGDEGLLKLSEDLQSCLLMLSTLIINLKSSSISFNGIKHFIEGLNHLAYLTDIKFYFPYNSITYDELQLIMKSFKIKTTFNEIESLLQTKNIIQNKK